MSQEQCSAHEQSQASGPGSLVHWKPENRTSRIKVPDLGAFVSVGARSLSRVRQRGSLEGLSDSEDTMTCAVETT